jgi:hypothetical protein
VPTIEQPVGIQIQENARGPATDRPPSGWSIRFDWWLGLGAVLVVSIGYMLLFIDRGWIPHDEGTLAQSAERVLSGEVPHRDFVHGYTGGLAYLNALAFKLFGMNLLALRYALLAAFVAWVVVFYHAATRLTSVLGAVVVTLTAVFWSVPNYPAGMGKCGLSVGLIR